MMAVVEGGSSGGCRVMVVVKVGFLNISYDIFVSIRGIF